MGDKSVSVVIPAYNAEKFIAEAISSIFNQSYRPLEIVVVNDGSTDSTVEVVRDLSAPNKVDINIIDLGENRGAANALNLGFLSAKGDYICWLSADDMFMDKNKTQKQVLCMERTGALWSYTSYCYMGPIASEAILMKMGYVPRFRMLDNLFIRDSHLRLMMLLFRNPINGSSIMIRRECLEEYGQFDPILVSIDADADLWMRYSALGMKVEAIQGSPVFWRGHLAQLSQRKYDMLYGCELTRLRMLLSLERNHKLMEYVWRFTPFLPTVFESGSYLSHPFVSEFLSNYILMNFENRILLRYVQRCLGLAQKAIASLCINKSRLYEDAQRISRSPMFTKFESVLVRGS